jgi:WD40 repeat protein
LRTRPWWTQDLAMTPDHRLLAAAGSGGAVLWPVEGPASFVPLTAASDANALGFSPDGMRLAAACDNGELVVWDHASGEMTHRMTGHDDRVRDVCWSPDGKLLATASTDRTARVWDASNGTELGVIGRHAEPLDAVAWSPDGHRLATGGRDGSVRIWRTRTDVPGMLAAAEARIFRDLTAEERRSLLLP